MKLIIGLGNPGAKYVNNRHNAGFLVVEQLKNQISNFQFLIFKSKNFMNDSGTFVLKLTKRYIPNPSYLYIIHDDLDIKLGEYKIQFGKGPKDHNGLVSIYEALGTRDFWHVRVGIDWRDEKGEMRKKGKEYVLEDFTKEEKKILNKTIKEICKKLVIL